MRSLQKVVGVVCVMFAIGFTACVDDEVIAPNDMVGSSTKSPNVSDPTDSTATDVNDDFLSSKPPGRP
ncbi:MAG: hypothetical protein LPJ89_10650 [Hymenobacteraceae bacterium]|nr:hypothetical protein [Hymenobacteraceae bacterium]MDX5395753.1 hypothetical protein [Hymenobacteraceae bacterium]MDX5444226.1 hypothetical protein [Hymenobacteraceae bacterium]MDX5511808.1 hypothetical protein [Hymenobacteraceae bacterium]